jgi:transcriptional regulator with XRE-family HTH domain
LPFARIKLKSLISKPYDFEPETLGEHVQKKRLEMGLMQRDVAEQLAVNSWTILNWEKGHTMPSIESVPAIVRLLGYDPFPEPTTLPQLLLAKRREMGWSMKEAAEAVGVDPGTWGNWECGQTILYRQHRALVARLLDLSADALNQEMALLWNQSHERAL